MNAASTIPKNESPLSPAELPFAVRYTNVSYAGQSSHSRRFSPIAALARSYFCKIKSVTTSPVGPPKNWPEGGCVWGLKRQLWWQPNAIHDLPLLLIRDAPLLGIESLRV